MNTDFQKNSVSLLKVMPVFLLLVIGIYLLPEKILYATIRENGPIEILSAAGYFLFILLALFFTNRGSLKIGIAPILFMFLLGLRELDFHDRFTTMGMFKIKFFISSEVPVAEKLVVILFILVLLVYGISYLRHVLPGFKRDLLSGRSYAFFTACAVGCMLFSKLLDSYSVIIEIFLPMLDKPAVFSNIIEECLELFIPILCIGALLWYRRGSRQGGTEIPAPNTRFS